MTSSLVQTPTIGSVARSFLVLSTTCLLACAHATPVVPAPVAFEEAPRLAAALHGTCEVTATQEPGEARKQSKGLTWTFNEDGTGKFDVPGGMLFGNKFRYRVEGRNVLTDGTYKAIRVDDWSSPTLALFFYDITQTYYCTKR